MHESARHFSDDDIITSVLEGRTQHFEVLIHRYSKKIINFIYRMIQDFDEAQNLAQEVFLKVFENLSYYKKENNFSAFIFKISKNLALNQIKKQKRTVFFSRILGRDLEKEDFRLSPTPHKTIEAAQRENLLKSGLLKLPEEQRLALILKVYLDFSYKQIADITGWSIPKIETLISRAKSTLKKNIDLQEKMVRVV